MKKFLLVTVVSGFLVAMAMTPVFAKPGAPVETNVVDYSECTNQGTMTIVGSFNFGYALTEANIDVNATDCVGFYNEGGNHDVLMGDHDTGALHGFCDYKGKKVCYVNMSAVARANGHWMEDGLNKVVNRSLHCHQHEVQGMMGNIKLHLAF